MNNFGIAAGCQLLSNSSVCCFGRRTEAVGPFSRSVSPNVKATHLPFVVIDSESTSHSQLDIIKQASFISLVILFR